MIQIEQIKTSDDVEEAWNELRSELRRIDEAIRKANQAATEAMAEIKDLEENVLPGLLAERFLDEKISKTEITKVKKRRAELEEFMGDLSLSIKGLEAKKRQPNSEARKVEHRERHIQNYEKIRIALQQKYSIHLEQNFLNQAELLGRQGDANRFLKDLRKGLKN